MSAGARAPLAAVEWAETVPDGARVSVAVVEARTFVHHRAILSRLGPEGRQLAATMPRPGAQGSFWLWMLIGVVLVGMPVVGFAFVWDNPFNPERIDAATGVPVAGICFGIAAAVQLGSLVRWLRRGRRRSGAMLWSGALAAAMAAVTLPALAVAAARDGLAAWAPCAVLVGVGGALGAVVALLQLLASHRVTEADDRDALIAGLPADERAALTQERDRALDVLVRRGLLTAAVAERARRSPLGTLADAAAGAAA